jgi:voltage-gated potassium channel Kch
VKNPHSTLKLVSRKAWRLVSNPIFPVLTVAGNFLIAAGAFALFYFEHEINPTVKSPLDALWWAVSTVSTVGYGDVTPITPHGRVAGIVLMILGTALFWSYTALFADALLSDEMSDLESELRQIDKRLRKLNVAEDHSSEVATLVRELQRQVRDLSTHKK